jgi:hypothetical protein
MDVTHWQIKQRFLADGRPWTRQSYIDYAWPGVDDLPLDEWDEGELPPDLQDWSAPAPTK